MTLPANPAPRCDDGLPGVCRGGQDGTRPCAGGQSAGGSLAAAAARPALESGGRETALQFLHYAVLDLVTPARDKRRGRLAFPAWSTNADGIDGITPALVIITERDRPARRGRDVRRQAPGGQRLGRAPRRPRRRPRLRHPRRVRGRHSPDICAHCRPRPAGRRGSLSGVKRLHGWACGAPPCCGMGVGPCADCWQGALRYFQSTRPGMAPGTRGKPHPTPGLAPWPHLAPEPACLRRPGRRSAR